MLLNSPCNVPELAESMALKVATYTRHQTVAALERAHLALILGGYDWRTPQHTALWAEIEALRERSSELKKELLKTLKGFKC